MYKVLGDIGGADCGEAKRAEVIAVEAGMGQKESEHGGNAAEVGAVVSRDVGQGRLNLKLWEDHHRASGQQEHLHRDPGVLVVKRRRD